MQVGDVDEIDDLDHQLVLASRKGDDTRVAVLIDEGASCDAVHDLGDPHGAGRSAVYWAARGGHVSTFRLLKSKGADVHAAADNGITPFMAATLGGSIQIARELKEDGADAGATDNNGCNAVHAACQYGHLDILRALKGWNVDVHATTDIGHNAVHIA